jgi:hypothetical protein
MIVNDYRSSANTTSTGSTVLYFDEVRVGTSRDAVEIPRGTSLLAVRP